LDLFRDSVGTSSQTLSQNSHLPVESKLRHGREGVKPAHEFQADLR
jgi:hypothetical protein